MDLNFTNLDEIKETIKLGIDEKIDFKELRKRLPHIHKKPLIAIIYDVMNELEIRDIPFPGLLTKPKFARKPIPVSDTGKINITELLEEKGFDDLKCEAFASVGAKKITLTIKPVKIKN